MSDFFGCGGRSLSLSGLHPASVLAKPRSTPLQSVCVISPSATSDSTLTSSTRGNDVVTIQRSRSLSGWIIQMATATWRQTLQLQLKDSTFYYNIRDSLSTAVYREYRHHFLWWKWGTRGYRLKIVNFNPHARNI